MDRKKINKIKAKDKSIRLNKYLAHGGIASRREADRLIEIGLIEVNGKVTTQLGVKVFPSDIVRYNGEVLKPEKKAYILLNKPKGFISSVRDEKGRKTVMDLVQNASPYRLYPVGRLDRQTTGLLLVTNDGDLSKKMTHPSHRISKIYHVVLNKKLTASDLQKIREGVMLKEGVAKVEDINYVQGATKKEVGISLHIGWNRIIRRIFESLDYELDKLDRVSFAGLTKKNIPRGHWRFLTEKEIRILKTINALK